MMPIHRSWKQDSLTSATRDPDREPSELALRGRTHNTIHTCAGGGTWTCDMARHKPGVSSGADPGRTGETSGSMSDMNKITGTEKPGVAGWLVHTRGTRTGTNHEPARPRDDVRRSPITSPGPRALPPSAAHTHCRSAVHCAGRSTLHTASACRSPTGEERSSEQHGGA